MNYETKNSRTSRHELSARRFQTEVRECLTEWLGMMREHIEKLDKETETPEMRRRFLHVLSRVVAVFGRFSGYQKLEVEVSNLQPITRIDFGGMSIEERQHLLSMLEDDSTPLPKYDLTLEQRAAVERHFYEEYEDIR